MVSRRTLVGCSMRRSDRLEPLLEMAGFQLSINGRFGCPLRVSGPGATSLIG